MVGVSCGREACITCTQGGEEIPPCTKRSLVYENICLKCHPGAKNKGEYKGGEAPHPGIYVGESSKSIAERSSEHWQAFREAREDSHIHKHHQVHHGGVGVPEFHMKVVKYYSSALRRQVGEAIRIRRRGESVLLNSKAEYSRCNITRLTLPEVTPEKPEGDRSGEGEEEWQGERCGS